jgi:hypothetical protein
MLFLRFLYLSAKTETCFAHFLFSFFPKYETLPYPPARPSASLFFPLAATIFIYRRYIFLLTSRHTGVTINET